VDARDARHLWGQRYEQPMSELQTMPERISTEITERLRHRLSGEQRDRIARNAPGNRDAYELYMRGLYAWNLQTNPSAREAATFFQRAILADSTFARAYAGLADAYWFLSAGDPEFSESATISARKALTLDPQLPDAHVALAEVAWSYHWDWDRADREFAAAIRDNPGYEPAHTWYAYYLFAMGRNDDAVRHTQRALELDPLSRIAKLMAGTPAFYRHDYGEAIRIFQRLAEDDPKYSWGHYWLGFTLAQVGRYDEAENQLRISHALDQDPIELAELGRVYALSGQRDSAESIVHWFEERARPGQTSGFFTAKIHTALGQHDEAFRSLERALVERDASMPWLKADPDFEPLRADPRYHTLLRKMKLNS
jgi:tetratricopeptide (TPR) repeat protein